VPNPSADIPERIQKLCERVAARLRNVDGIEAVAIGGSWSRGTARADSDIDLGLAYDGHRPFSIDALNEAARELDDRHLDGIVTRLGEWGPGVNGGGWLLIDGNHVDFLYRDLNRVREIIQRCVAGQPDAVYQIGHPMGFQNQIYAGETHYCRPLLDRNGELARLKAMVAEYPEKLRVALVRKHLFDSAFHIEIAGKPAHRGDTASVSQCLSSATGFMTLVLYALNRRFYLNEKGAFLESARFEIRPARFHDQTGKILGALGNDDATLYKSVEAMREVHRELAMLCEKELPAAELKKSLGALWRE
jgi:predicted nucleotidyltransferase